MLAAGLLFALLSQSISGRVTDQTSGRPLPRILVTVSSADRGPQAQTLTDAEGRYQFGGLQAGKYSVAADNDDHVAVYLRLSANVDVASDAPATVDIALTRALGIEGHVFDSQGEPVSGASVSATNADGRTPGAYSATTDDLGAYRLFGMPAGQYRVCAAVLFGNNDPAPPDGAPLARTCYPDMPLASQDSFNIDIHMQPRESSAAGSIRAAPAAIDSTETGTIRGVVVDRPSGRPIPHATIHLGFRDPSPPRTELATRADANGVFTLTGLTPGRYDGFATAPAHVIASLTDRDNNHDLTVRKGETLQASAALGRAYAIALRLSDPYDAPVANVGVAIRSLDGDLLLPFERTSDDLGRIRVPDLPPGRYVVCAEPPGSAASPRTALPPKPDRLLRTCYPSAADEPDAQPVTIADGDLQDLEIRMARGRTGSISATVLTASGLPASHADIDVKRVTTELSNSTWLTTDANGRFRMSNVQPGTYAIDAGQGDDAAFVSVRVDDEDVDNVEIAMRKTVTVAGHVGRDDPSGPPPAATGRVPLMLTTRLADDRLPGEGSSRIGTVNSDGSFSMTGLFGRRTFDLLNPPPGWFVKSMQYGTADALDHAVEIKNADDRLEVVLSTRGATIKGTVADVIDKRVPRAQVFLIRVAASKDDPPRLAGNVISVSGNYGFGPLRDGEYVVVAVPANVPVPQPMDGERLAQLAALGERVTLTDLDQRTIDLRVTAAPK